MTKRQKLAMLISNVIFDMGNFSRTRLLRVVFLLVVYFSLPHAYANDKFALVIGNGSYQNNPLNNALNDANDMAQALTSIGFKVMLKTDLSRADTLKALREFSNQLNKDSIGVFYYSGHALQYQNDNYLLPIDIKNIQNSQQISRLAVPLSRVLEEIDIVGNETNILILDACRTYPGYSGQMGISLGLAKMSAPPGTLIAYSTTPGKVAQDGSGNNSPYTEQLKKLITTPNLLVEQLFNRVRDAVMQATDNQQVPSEQSYLRGDFYFAGQIDDRALATLETERLLEKFRKSEAKKRAASQQQALKNQLTRCENYEKAHRLSTQNQESALSCYQTVLKIAPDNETALARLSSLERRYLSWTESALRHQAWDKAHVYLKVLKRINANNSALLSLQNKLKQGQQHQQENQQIDSITDQLLNQTETQSYWQMPQAHLRLLPDQDFVFYLPIKLSQLGLPSQIELLEAKELPTWLHFNSQQRLLFGHAPATAAELPESLRFSATNQIAQTENLTLSLHLLSVTDPILSLAIAPKIGALHEIVFRCLQSMQTLPLAINTISSKQALAGLRQQRFSAFFPWTNRLTSHLQDPSFLRSHALNQQRPKTPYLLISKYSPSARKLLIQFNKTLKKLQQQGVIFAIQQRYS